MDLVAKEETLEFYISPFDFSDPVRVGAIRLSKGEHVLQQLPVYIFDYWERNPNFVNVLDIVVLDTAKAAVQNYLATARGLPPFISEGD